MVLRFSSLLSLFIGLFFFIFSCQTSNNQDLPALEETGYDGLGSGYYAIQLDSDAKADAFYTYHPERIPLLSAHRGGPYPGFPENSIEAFEQVTFFMPAIIECDIMQTADGALIMMHDNTLDRTTTGTGRVDEVSLAYIQSLHLVDKEGNQTDFRIPTLDDVLAWGRDRVVFTLDVKRGVPFDKVVEAVERHQSVRNAVIITYSIDDAMKVHALNPDLRISISLGSREAIDRWRASGIPARNTVAFVGTSEREQVIYDELHAEGILCILGTMGNLDRQALARGEETYLGLLNGKADILSTDRPIEAWSAISAGIDESSSHYTDFFRFIMP